MIKLVVFDWDDTFTTGAREGYYACYHEVADRLNIAIPESELRARIDARWGRTVEEEIESMLRDNPSDVAEGVEVFNELLKGDMFVEHLSIIPGSVDLLNRLSKTYKLGIASGVNPGVLISQIFPKFRIPDVFTAIETVYDLDDPEHAKPHPHMLLSVIHAAGVTPEETVMVGDARGDVEMARRAGATPIVVLTGHLDRETAQDMGVQHIVENVALIEPILEQL